MSDQIGAIDAWATLITPEKSTLWPDSFWHIFRRYGVEQEFRGGKTVEQMLDEMDEAGVDRALLSASICSTVFPPLNSCSTP